MQEEVDKSIDFEKLKIIGKALKKLRTDQGFSNYQLRAEKLNMAHSQYNAYEVGM
jgi:hypothetical protein